MRRESRGASALTPKLSTLDFTKKAGGGHPMQLALK